MQNVTDSNSLPNSLIYAYPRSILSTRCFAEVMEPEMFQSVRTASRLALHQQMPLTPRLRDLEP